MHGFTFSHERARIAQGSVSQISTADRTHARTGPDTQRAQAHTHTQNSSTRTQPDSHLTFTRTHSHPSRHTPSATPTRERTRQGNHGLRDLHRPLRQRLRPLPPLLLHLPLPPHLVKLVEAGEAGIGWVFSCSRLWFLPNSTPVQKYRGPGHTRTGVFVFIIHTNTRDPSGRRTSTQSQTANPTTNRPTHRVCFCMCECEGVSVF